MKKIWIEISISTEAEQIVTLKPTPELDGIELAVKELDGTNSTGGLYLSYDEASRLAEELVKFVIDSK